MITKLEVILRQLKNNSETMEFWQKQIDSAKKYPGSKAAFCRTNSLSVHTLNYYIKKFDKEKKLTPRVARPFVEVMVEKPINQVKRSLPDPKWVAELILHLQEGAQ